MTSIFPITLVGENLGKRHLYLNTLVNEAYKKNVDFETLKNLPEKSPIDRLYKIDYASKIRDVDYIIQNLKENDMLYVSRALKSTWLLDKRYHDIINPKYLEDSIYPEMVTTAVIKMQHWIHINLKDETRCYEFYDHYYKNNVFDISIKFLTKCSQHVIQEEFTKVMHKINPHYFKILCQKCSQVAKIFYEIIPHNEELRNLYLSKEKDYFLAIRHVLRTNTDLILDINEKYCNMDGLYRFSASQTKFIMRHHIERFWKKPELYATCLLNIQALADSFGSQEAKDLVLKLARAKYLTSSQWYSYKRLEPLIKRIVQEERAKFKKKVFVDKDVGDEIEEWPYETPALLVLDSSEYSKVFDDHMHEPYEYERLQKIRTMKRIMKRKGKCDTAIMCCSDEYSVIKVKSLLDKLFDEFRFASFGQTLYDLRKRIAAESSPQNREFMILVLVSKSGGKPENIALLLDLLIRHNNEAPNVRAAIVRSLVKRAHIWRLPESTWKHFLDFGQGLGLDGKTSVAECYEGLHAVVIRSLLLTGECESTIFNTFLDQFSTLKEYSLSVTEKQCIEESMPKQLLFVAKEKQNVVDAVTCINKLLDFLIAYKVNIESYPGYIEIVAENADKDVSVISYILTRLFQGKVARKQLFYYNFELVKTDASYVNALRHDIAVLDAKKFAEYYKKRIIIKSDNFLNKLSIYFNEDHGLANSFLNHLKEHICHKHLGRPLAYLLGDRLQNFVIELDTFKDKKMKAVSAAIRANAHLSRPAIDIDSFGWERAGAKLIANQYLKCRSTELDNSIEKLLKWKRTAKLALTLSKRTNYETAVFIKLASYRPTIAIKSGLKLMKLYGEDFDPLIWDTIKPIIQKLDISKSDRFYLVKTVANIKETPFKIRPEYSTVIYLLFKDINYFKSMAALCYVEILLPDVNNQFIANLLEQYLRDDFVIEKQLNVTSHVTCTCLYIRILIKYLLLSKSENIQKHRLETFGDTFFAKMEDLGNCPERKAVFPKYLREVITTLKYNKVFLNAQYVSSLPVMEKVVVWTQNIFSIDEHFKTFALLHLSMIYYKSVRHALKLIPEVFIDVKTKHTDGVKIVGNLFGKYIAKEVNILASKYFDSIIELYYDCLVVYLDQAGQYCIPSAWLSSIIKGILEESKGLEYRMGVYLLKEKLYNLTDDDCQEIKQYLNEMECRAVPWCTYYM